MQVTRLYTLLFLSFLFPATGFSDVFNPGPSNPTQFTNVIDLPADAALIDNSIGVVTIGGVVGETTQVNLDSGTLGTLAVRAEEGAELNINGGTVTSAFLIAEDGSELNISGGDILGISVFETGSVTNVSGGSVNVIAAINGSELNLYGSNFALDGFLLNGLIAGQPLTVPNRNATLSGLLADGTPFSYDLNPNFVNNSTSQFEPDATLTVTLVAVPEPTSMTILLLGFGLASMRRNRSAA